MRLRKQLLIIIILLAGCLQTEGQTAADMTAHTRTFGISDGLAVTGISGMAQDSQGLMWIATWNGLYCYDGYRFITFPGNSWGDENALSTNRIAMLKVDSKDNLWLRTYDGGIYLFDTKQCRYVNIGQMVNKKFGGKMKPRNIYCLPSGHTWVTDETGEMTLRINDETPTDINNIEVFGTKGYQYSGKIIYKVQADKHGRALVTTESNMLCYEGNGKFSKANVKEQDLQKDEDDTALTWRLKVCGVDKNDIQKYHIDRQGNLWFSSAYGLTLVNFRKQRMKYEPVVAEQQTRSVVCRHNGTVLAGSNDGYVCTIGTAQKMNVGEHVYALFEDSQERLWIGTKGNGLFLVDSNGNTTHCMPDSTDKYALSHRYVYDIDEDPQGNIWIATYGGGVNMVKGKELTGKEKIRFVNSNNDLKGYALKDFPRVRRITHTSDGIMLISTTTGLLTTNSRKPSVFYATRHEQNDTSSLRTSDVMQVLVTKKGSIYVATQGGGIQTITSEKLLANKLQLHHVNVLNFNNGNVQSMTEDAKGMIWIVRETGIDRYNAATGQLQQERIETGSADDQPTILTEALSAYGADGRLWIGTVGGVLSFNTAEMPESHFRPSIVFTGVQYQGEQERQPLLYRETLEVTPDKRSMTVSFTALDYNDNSLMQYAWRMDDENGWNYIRTPHISFSNLSPGRHQLIVRSTNSDGIWTDNAAILEIDVKPLWWERRWVQFLMLIAVIILSTWGVFAWLRYRQRTREREQRLERILRQYRELQERVNVVPSTTTEEATATQEPAKHEYKLAEPQIVNEDEIMMDNLMAFIEQRIDDEGLRIDDMADAVGMGRTAFYEKIRQLVGVSPSDFLRQVRMQRARQLVEKSSMTFSQIAYAVGFTDPKYFSKCFKKETGMTPSEYRSQTGVS